MSAPVSILVSGASGHLGQIITQELLKIKSGGAKIHVIAASRNTGKLAALAKAGAELRTVDLDKPETIEVAFKGVNRVILISTDSIGKRVAQHKAAIKAAEKVGVQWLGYTSVVAPDTTFLIERDHFETEVIVASSASLKWTIFRVNIYADMAPQPVPGTDTIFHSSGKLGRAFLPRAEVGVAVANGAAKADQFSNQVVSLTGTEALTHDQLAQIHSQLSGKSIKALEIPLDAWKQNLVKAGLPAPFVESLADIEVLTSQGVLAIVTNDFERLVGRKPQDFTAFLKEFLASAPAH